MNQRRKSLVKWMNNPFTKKFYNIYLEDKKKSEMHYIALAQYNFANGILDKRTENEILARIGSTNLILTRLTPLFQFLEVCKKEGIDLENPDNEKLQKLGIEDQFNNFLNEIYEQSE